MGLDGVAGSNVRITPRRLRFDEASDLWESFWLREDEAIVHADHKGNTMWIYVLAPIGR